MPMPSRSSSVARSAASLLMSRLSVAAIALIFLGVGTRILTLEEMAVFAVYNTFCGFLTVVCSLGLLASCIKQVPALRAAARHAEAAALIRLAATVYAVGAVTVTGLLWSAAGPISSLLIKTPDRAPEVRLAAIAALCFGLYEASQLLLSARQEYARQGRLNVAAALAQRVASIALFFPFGLRGYLAGFAAGSLLGAALGLARVVWGTRQEVPGGAPLSAAASIHYARPFYLDGYLRYLYMHADQLLVGIFLAPADLAIYFVAKRFIQYCQVLVSSLTEPLGARVAEIGVEDRGAVARAHATSFRWFLLLFVPLCVLLACVSPLLVRVVGGARYDPGALPLALLFLSVPFFAAFSLESTFLFVLGRPRERLLTNLVSSLVQIASVALLMPWLSLPGLALARAAGFAVGTVHARWRLAAGRLVQRAGGRERTEPSGRGFGGMLGLTAAMAAMILIPHALMGDPRLIPLYAAPALGVCLVGFPTLVLSPAERAGLAAALPGRGRGARWLRSAVAGAGADPAR
ncbi:MAG TPA: oligosaccharide flippase family protein [Candidatus Polarisedimenticolia bacterium]|nr:oligosaccharide flippase family protein [Candidatus Polarisedimenticolia bacterium]